MPSKYLSIDIQHAQLKGGRMNISADTTVKRVRDARKASLHKLIERGNFEVVEAVREGRIHITEVDRAVRDGKYDDLTRRAKQKAGPVAAAVDSAIKKLAESREPGTTKVYRVCGNALAAHFGDRVMDTITTDELADFMHAAKLRGKAWSSNSKRNYSVYCRKIWETAGADPALWDEIEMPKHRKTRVVFLKPQEWRTFASENNRLPVAAIGAIGCLAGLRIGEISQLRTNVDVDFDRRVIRVQPRAGWKPKTDRSVRDVPMAEELEPILRYHAANFAGAKYFIRRPGMDQPVDIRVLGDWVTIGLKRAGLPTGRNNDGYTTHTFRHTFASWLAQRDVQLLKIAALLGDTPEMVAKTYAHLTPRDLDRAVMIIDDVARNAGVTQ